MYPFGSGMQRPQPPNNNNNKQSMPFGVGWVAQPQPQQHQTPYPATNSSPYPTNSSPYPAANSHPSATPSGGSYPTNSGSQAYPSSTSYPNSTSYPSSSYPHSTQNNPYPSQNTGYPASSQNNPYPSQNAGYPPVAQNNPYPSQNAGYPTSNYPQSTSYPQNSSYSSTNQYPTSQSAVYPQSGYQVSHTPSSTNSNDQSFTRTGMAQCFNEMKNSNIRNKGRPIVAPFPSFDPNADAHALRKAMKGFGTDEDALINIICRRSNEQRQEIQRQYKTHFGKDLIEDIRSETSGNFEKLLVGLLRPIVDYYCTELSDAMAGIGTDEDVLIEILCTLSNSEIHTIKNAYLRMFGAHLESELKSETSGNFKRLLVSLCCATRDESGRVDPIAAQQDARELLNAGELRVGTDESMFNMVLCQRNYQQLKMILDEYANITGHSLEKAIKREFSGDIQEGLLAICKCVTTKTEYFASRLHKSMAGIGTNDKQLIRVIITRSEIDLQDIKDTFEKMYGKSLKSWIKGDTSGHYKHALYAMIGEQRSS